MAPSFVLLNRDVAFTIDLEIDGGRGKSICCPWVERERRPSRKETSEAITEYLRTFRARAVVVDPPQLSFIHLMRPPVHDGLPPSCYKLDSGRISSVDKNLVAIYAGVYRPGSSIRGMGGYQIYDAKKNSLSAIPQLIDDDFHAAIGCQSAVVMCNRDDSGYVLAELVWVRPGLSQGALWLWKPSAPGWALQTVRLDLPLGFCSHLCFSYRGSILCWVDLLRGMVVCDLDKDLELRFIPLPKECPSYDTSSPQYRDNLCSEEFRSMACVGDAIKFVSMDGYVEHEPGKEFELVVYTLSPDLSGWTISKEYNVSSIWANESFLSTGMTKIAPSFPVLSIHEDGVIYLVFTDIRVADKKLQPFGSTGLQLEFIGQHLVRVDMENNKLLFYPESKDWIIDCQLLGSELSAYQQCLQDHPREIQASGKRMKL